MRDDGVFKDVPRARRGVIGALLLVFVVIAAAAPSASVTPAEVEAS